MAEDGGESEMNITYTYNDSLNTGGTTPYFSTNNEFTISNHHLLQSQSNEQPPWLNNSSEHMQHSTLSNDELSMLFISTLHDHSESTKEKHSNVLYDQLSKSTSSTDEKTCYTGELKSVFNINLNTTNAINTSNQFLAFSGASQTLDSTNIPRKFNEQILDDLEEQNLHLSTSAVAQLPSASVIDFKENKAIDNYKCNGFEIQQEFLPVPISLETCSESTNASLNSNHTGNIKLETKTVTSKSKYFLCSVKVYLQVYAKRKKHSLCIVNIFS